MNSSNFFVPHFNTTAFGLRYVGLVLCPANQFMPWRYEAGLQDYRGL